MGLLSLFRKSKSVEDSGMLQGFCDCHSHLLPGVDDGIKTLEETMAVLAHYEKSGVKEVWLTPHIMEDIPNTTEKLQAKFEEVCNAYQGNIRLRLGAEYMIDNLLNERLATGDLLSVGGRLDHLLVETSYFNKPILLQSALKRIRLQGLFPLLAHPERYEYMDKNDYHKLVKEGVKFQINLFSLIGTYGGHVKQKAEWLVKQDYYHCIGMDVHSYASLCKMLAQPIHTIPNKKDL